MPALACWNLIDFSLQIPNSPSAADSLKSLAFNQPASSRATCFSAIAFATIVPCVRAHLVWLCHPPLPTPFGHARPPVSRKPPDARLAFLIANSTLPPSPHLVHTPAHARGSGTLRVGWAGGSAPNPGSQCAQFPFATMALPRWSSKNLPLPTPCHP